MGSVAQRLLTAEEFWQLPEDGKHRELVGGEVVEVNQALAQDPALVNNDPYGQGWMIKLRITDEAELEQLLGAAEYGAHIGQ